MNNSNDDSIKQGSIQRLTKEEEKAEDDEIKSKLFNKSYDADVMNKKMSTNTKEKTTPRRADGVMLLGICPDCGGKLGTVGDKHGSTYTKCEHFKDGCRFYVPYKSSHFI